MTEIRETTLEKEEGTIKFQIVEMSKDVAERKAQRKEYREIFSRSDGWASVTQLDADEGMSEYEIEAAAGIGITAPFMVRFEHC